MKTKFLSSVGACAAALLTSLPSQAGFVTSNIGFMTNTIYGFTEANLLPGTVVTYQYQGVGFPSLFQRECDLPNIQGGCIGNASGNASGSAPSISPFSISFDSVQTQAGFNFAANAGSSVFEAFLGDVSVSSGNAVSGGAGTDPNFYGFDLTSEGKAFDRITVTVGGSGANMSLDNLTFNKSANPVPEPGSLALAGLALAALAWRRRT